MFETDALVFECLEITVNFFRLTRNFRRTALPSKKVILVRLVHWYSVGAKEISRQLFSTTCGNRKVANSTYWGLAGGYILPKNSHCFTRTCKGCPKTYMTLCFQISNSFDISQYSFACVIKINFDCFFPSKHNVSVFALYIHWTDPSLFGCRSLWQPWSTQNTSTCEKAAAPVVGVDIALSTDEQPFLDDNVVTGESWYAGHHSSWVTWARNNLLSVLTQTNSKGKGLQIGNSSAHKKAESRITTPVLLRDWTQNFHFDWLPNFQSLTTKAQP